MSTTYARQPIDLRNYKVVESSDLETANPDGTVTCPAGEETVIMEHEPTTDDTTTLLHALGASDAPDIRFRLRYATNISFTMESPPGGVNDPYSYTNELGAPLTTTRTLKLTAVNDGGASKDLVSRGHVEVR